MTDTLQELLGGSSLLGEFAQLVDRHNRLEFEQDLEGVMATVCDDPFYEFEPLGWVIRDRALLRDFYVEVMPILRKFEPAGGKMRAFAGEDGIIMWDRSSCYRHDDDRLTPLNMVAIIVRDPTTGLIKGEQAFMDMELADIFRDFLSPVMQARLTKRGEKDEQNVR